MRADPFDVSDIPTPQHLRDGLTPEQERDEVASVLDAVRAALRGAAKGDTIVPLGTVPSDLGVRGANAALEPRGWRVEYLAFGGWAVVPATDAR